MKKIVITFEIDTHENLKPVYGTMTADARLGDQACVVCDVKRGFRFVPADPMGSEVDMCLTCAVISPDVVKIVAE